MAGGAKQPSYHSGVRRERLGQLPGLGCMSVGRTAYSGEGERGAYAEVRHSVRESTAASSQSRVSRGKARS